MCGLIIIAFSLVVGCDTLISKPYLSFWITRNLNTLKLFDCKGLQFFRFGNQPKPFDYKDLRKLKVFTRSSLRVRTFVVAAVKRLTLYFTWEIFLCAVTAKITEKDYSKNSTLKELIDEKR